MPNDIKLTSNRDLHCSIQQQTHAMPHLYQVTSEWSDQWQPSSENQPITDDYVHSLL